VGEFGRFVAVLCEPQRDPQYEFYEEMNIFKQLRTTRNETTLGITDNDSVKSTGSASRNVISIDLSEDRHDDFEFDLDIDFPMYDPNVQQAPILDVLDTAQGGGADARSGRIDDEEFVIFERQGPLFNPLLSERRRWDGPPSVIMVRRMTDQLSDEISIGEEPTIVHETTPRARSIGRHCSRCRTHSGWSRR
jgi:hypothetical protein